MEIGAPFVAHAQPPEVVEPGQGAFHHPAMATQALTESIPLRAMRMRMWRRDSAWRQRGMS